MNIAIVEAFIVLKEFALNYYELSIKLIEMEDKYQKKFKDIFDAINYLIKKEKQSNLQKKRRKIGYK